MIWGSFALALVVGMIVSAGVYAAYLWPDVEPSGPEPESPPPPPDADPLHEAPGTSP